MKIILKQPHYNWEKEFENKKEMINYIKTYLEYKVDEKIKNTDTIYDLKEKFFADYELIKNK